MPPYNGFGKACISGWCNAKLLYLCCLIAFKSLRVLCKWILKVKVKRKQAQNVRQINHCKPNIFNIFLCLMHLAEKCIFKKWHRIEFSKTVAFIEHTGTHNFNTRSLAKGHSVSYILGGLRNYHKPPPLCHKTINML